MAGDAADVISRVLRVDGVHVLRAAGVTGEAASVNFLRCCILKGKDLAYVAATRYVLCAGTMAALTALVRRAAFGVQGSLPVRRLCPAVVNLLVTRFAGLRSHISLRARSTGCAGRRFFGGGCMNYRCGGRACRGRLRSFFSRLLGSLACRDGDYEEKRQHRNNDDAGGSPDLRHRRTLP